MNLFRSCAPPRQRCSSGFTLVEIMIVVVIIGLLAAMAIPALGRVRQKSISARFVSDLRVFAQSFETHATQNGGWPPNAGNGVVPVGMSGEFKAATWAATNSLGGRWNWDYNAGTGVAGIAVTNVTVSDAEMAAIDAKIDDGDLSTGLFQKISTTRFIYFMQQ